MDIIVQIALNALIEGAVYALVATGFNLIYATARFFDLGYGALSIAGAYAVLFLYKTLQLPLSFSLVAGTLFAGGAGFLVQYLVYRPLRARKASGTVLLVASIGVLTVVQAGIAMLFTSQFQTLSRDPGSTRVFNVLGGAITEVQLIILGVALIIMVALTLTLRYTLFGKAIRAVADDEEVAQTVGINTNWFIGIVFFIGTAIGGVAGIATGFDTGMLPTMGLVLLLGGVIASIIGGVGNPVGGVLGAFLLAVIENIGVWVFSGEWRSAITFSVLILFLLLRPRGLFKK